MTDPRELYTSWLRRGSYLNQMLECGPDANRWLEHALINCLPMDIFDEWKDALAFLSTVNRDAFRIARATREKRELIVISERIIPKGPLSEDNPRVRYFIFAALHEVAHAIKQHKPPNEISDEDNKAQENEADDLAYRWYNGYVRSRGNAHLPELTRVEVERAQAANRAAMNAEER